MRHMYITAAKPIWDGIVILEHTFVYVLEGALVIQPGKPAATYGPGQAFHEPPHVAHDARSASATAPLKILVFQAVEKESAARRPGQVAAAARA